MKRLFSILSCTILAITASASANTVNPINKDIEFPDVSKSYLKNIPRYDPIQLIHIDRGINDDTVRQLIGNPHFSEFNSNNWNYIFNIRLPNSRNYIQCQLQLHYNKDDVVENYYWNNPQCAEVIETTLKPVPTTIQPKKRTFTLSSDLLFDFDSADVKSSSAFNINKLSSSIHQAYNQVHSIKIIGHTDYLGNASYNYELALKRANAIRDELIRRGFNPSSMTISSMGESSPLTNSCQNMSNEQTKLCLAPYRRVEVQVVGRLR